MSRRLAEYVVKARFEDLSEKAVVNAKRATLDTIAAIDRALTVISGTSMALLPSAKQTVAVGSIGDSHGCLIWRP